MRHGYDKIAGDTPEGNMIEKKVNYFFLFSFQNKENLTYFFLYHIILKRINRYINLD